MCLATTQLAPFCSNCQLSFQLSAPVSVDLFGPCSLIVLCNSEHSHCLWVYHICRPESCMRHTANCKRGKCAMRIQSLCDSEAQSNQTARHATTGRAIIFFEDFCEVLYGAASPNDGSDHPPAPVSLDAPALPA
jgi:hypothetical protein